MNSTSSFFGIPVELGVWLMRLLIAASAIYVLLVSLLSLINAGTDWTAETVKNAGEISSHPAAYVALEKLVIKRSPRENGEALIIGRNELGQFGGSNSADRRHIAIRLVGDTWEMANVSVRRRLVVTPPSTGRDRYSRPIEIDGSATIILPTSKIQITKSQMGRFDLTVDHQNRTKDSYTLLVQKNGQARLIPNSNGQQSQTYEELCLAADGSIFGPIEKAIAPFRPQIEGTVNAVLGNADELNYRPVLMIGGRFLCEGDTLVPPTLPIVGMEFDGVRLTQFDGGLYLTPARSLEAAVENDVVETFDTSYQTVALPQQRGEFTAGRTVYRASVDRQTGDLIIRPQGRVHRFFGPLDRKDTTQTLPQDGCFLPSATQGAACNFTSDDFDAYWFRLGGSKLTAPEASAQLKSLGFGLGLAIVMLVLRTMVRDRGVSTNLTVGAIASTSVLFVALLVSGAAFYFLFEYGRAGMLTPAQETQTLAISWIAASVSWSIGRSAHIRLALIAALVTIITLGAATQLHMSVFAETTKYQVYWQNTFSSFAAIALLLCLFRMLPTSFLVNLASRHKRVSARASVVVLIAVIVLTIVQHLFGSEEGIAGFQPTELNKIIFVALIALIGTYLLARWEAGYDFSSGSSGAVRRGVQGVFLFLTGLIIAAPIFSSDMSPTLLMTIVSLCIVFVGVLCFAVILISHRIKRPPRGLVARVKAAHFFTNVRHVLAGAQRYFVVIVLLLAPALIYGGLSMFNLSSAIFSLDKAEDSYFEASGPAQTMIERFISFHDVKPTSLGNSDGLRNLQAQPRYLELSHQVDRSRANLRAADCNLQSVSSTVQSERKLKDVLLAPLQDLRSDFCQSLGRTGTSRTTTGASSRPNPFSIPAVHDDFAGAYLIASFGVDAGLALLLAQAILIILLALLSFMTLVRMLDRASVPFDRNLRRFTGLASLSLAFLFAMQFLLGWGNTYGLFPVMGQPMTFVSAGMSHILAMGVGLLVFADLALRLMEAGPIRPASLKFAKL